MNTVLDNGQYVRVPDSGPEYSSDGRFYRSSPNADWQPVPPDPVEALLGRAKSRTTYVLLAIFLGGLGVHNFYARRYVPAVIQLLVTLLLFWTVVTIVLVWLWVIVEACVVTCDGDARRMV